jgi:hypothetical protein
MKLKSLNAKEAFLFNLAKNGIKSRLSNHFWPLCESLTGIVLGEEFRGTEYEGNSYDIYDEVYFAYCSGPDYQAYTFIPMVVFFMDVYCGADANGMTTLRDNAKFVFELMLDQKRRADEEKEMPWADEEKEIPLDLLF